MLRHIPDDFEQSTVTAIDSRLSDVERDHDVTVALAVESGSRAWGFPSLDSDYDCRFVFVRPTRQHLALWPERDVIETPLEGDLDVNGWELAKALKLLLRGNAVILEWLSSAIIYRGDEVFRDSFRAFAGGFADQGLVGRHYLHLGERQRRLHFTDGKNVPMKKMFYVLRPAAVLRWLRLRPGSGLAPMHFPTLMAECDPPLPLLNLVEDLIARKAVTREMGHAPLPPLIAEFVDEELGKARVAYEDALPLDRPEARARAQTFFEATVRSFDRPI